MLEIYGFIFTELFLNEKLISSFGSAIAVSSISLNFWTDMLRVRVERGCMKYELWVGFGIKHQSMAQGWEAGNGENIPGLLSCKSMTNTHFCREDIVASDEQSKSPTSTHKH